MRLEAFAELHTLAQSDFDSGPLLPEVVRLAVDEVDLEERKIPVRQGKWRKDRVVPISKVSATFLCQHLSSRGVKSGHVFVCEHGAMSTTAVNGRFRTWALRTWVGKKGLSTHSIRNAEATHLLAEGADLRWVQELLGHESIETTVRYTHELIENLRRTYRRFHPRENELKKEVDGEYLAQVEALRAELRMARGKTEKRRAAVRRWYEGHRMKKGRAGARSE